MSKKSTIKKDPWTNKQRVFVEEYLVDFNGTRAAKVAGYSVPQVESSKLLQKPHIAKYIEDSIEAKRAALELSREDILLQLYYLATRKAGDFVDEDGAIKPIHQMSERAQAAIDGIEQEVFVNEETGDKRIKTKLRLSPKATAIDLAMKHKGLFAPDKQDVRLVKVDLTQLYEPVDEPDEIEARIEEVKRLPPKK